MSSIIFFLIVVGSLGTWWMSRQRLTTKPWLEEGIADEMPGSGKLLAPAKLGLGIFLVVVGALFSLLISAYSMRMQMSDWRSVPEQVILWPITGLLIMSSIALEWAKIYARREDPAAVKVSLLAAVLFVLLFLAGQFLVLRHLTELGLLLSSNPANSFFFLAISLHALHLLGGLAALGRVIDRAWRIEDADRLRLGISLCAAYWHFLLAIWLVLFALLSGWFEDFMAVCRQFLT